MSAHENAGVRRLNWGCGAEGEPGWINSDVKKGPGIDLPADIRDGLPLDTDSINYVVSIHALPEIPYPEIPAVLTELRRVIKPGGVLRLSLPDLEKGVAAYHRGDTEYFLVPDSDARSIGAKLITQITWYGYIRTPFVPGFIEELLVDAGFSAVHHVAYRQTASPWPGIVELDNRPAESLFVEGVK